MVGAMTNDHQRQRLPNRRFRRLLPAAVAAITIASSAPFVVADAAQARPAHPQRGHATPAGKIAALPANAVVRGRRVQANSAT
jgi:hypothetical protein